MHIPRSRENALYFQLKNFFCAQKFTFVQKNPFPIYCSSESLEENSLSSVTYLENFLLLQSIYIRLKILADNSRHRF